MIIKRIGNQDVILTEPEKDISLSGYIAMENILKDAVVNDALQEIIRKVVKVKQKENDDNQTEEDL